MKIESSFLVSMSKLAIEIIALKTNGLKLKSASPITILVLIS